MAFKINISTSDGKTYKLEVDAPGLKDKSLGDVVKGEEISPDLAGYELEITGASDKQGFTSMKDVPGFNRKKVLLNYGKAMHQRPKGEKKVGKKPLGLRLRKTVRGKVISDEVVQINTKVLKSGSKSLSEIFTDQNQTAAPAPEAKAEEAKPTKEPVEIKTEEAPQNANPENEPKETLPTEGNPEEEPKEAPKSVEEGTHPDEEPKQ